MFVINIISWANLQLTAQSVIRIAIEANQELRAVNETTRLPIKAYCLLEQTLMKKASDVENSEQN